MQLQVSAIGFIAYKSRKSEHTGVRRYRGISRSEETRVTRVKKRVFFAVLKQRLNYTVYRHSRTMEIQYIGARTVEKKKKTSRFGVSRFQAFVL